MHLGLIFVFFYDAKHQSLPLSACLLALSGSLLVACGFWITLQFQWIQYQNPGLVVAMESALFCLLPVVCPVIQTWAVSTLTGIAALPYFLLISMMVCHAICGVQLKSSFSKDCKHLLRPPTERPICDGFCCLVHAVGLLLLPSILYLGIHARCTDSAPCAFNILLLTSMSVLYCVDSYKRLSEMSNQSHAQLFERVQGVGRILSVVGIVVSLQHRVIFPSFAEFIVLQPPWNYAGVSLALFSLVAAMLDLCTLSPDEQFTKRGRTAVYLLVGVIAVSLSIGVPWFLLPAPILAAIALPSYLCKRSLTAFLAVILGVMVTIVWFLYYHFWSLDIHYGDITSQSMCLAVAVNVLAALVVAHCISEKGLSYLREWIAISYLTLFVLYEGKLLTAGDSGESIYPLYLFAATGMAGISVALHLRRMKIFSERACWAAVFVCASKVPLLLFPGGVEVLHFALIFSVAVFWPKYFHVSEKPIYWSLAVAFQLVLALFAVVNIRFFVFDTLNWIKGSRPSDGSLLGVLLLLACLLLTPLTFANNRGNLAGRKAVTIASIFSLIILLLEPPMPVKTGAACPKLPFGLCPRLWDSEHTPEHFHDDSEIYGEQSRRAHYAIWFLVLAAMLLLMVATQSHVKTGYSVLSCRNRAGFLKALCLVASGVFVGLYVSFEFFIGHLALQVVVCFSCSACTVLLALLMSGGDWGSMSRKLLFLLLVGSFPLAFVVGNMSQRGRRPQAAGESLARSLGSQEITAVSVVYACMFGLVAFVVKMKMRQWSRGADPTRSKVRYLRRAEAPGARQIMKLKDFSRLMLTELASDGKLWVPIAGNIATVTCFGAAMYASRCLAGNADGAVFLISPILLLLNQDPLFLRSLTMAKRYLPVSMCIAMYLVLNVCAHFYQQLIPRDLGRSRGITTGANSLLKDSICLLATLPSQAAFMYSLVNMTWRDRISSYLVPLNLPVLFLADLQTIKIIAALGIGEFCLQQLARRQLQKIGMRVL